MSIGSDMNIQAIGAYSQALENSATNIANLLTEGYRPVSTTFESGPDHVTALSVNLNDFGGENRSPVTTSGGIPSVLTSQGNGVDLAREMVNMGSYERGFQVNMTAAGIIEQTNGTLLNMFA